MKISRYMGAFAVIAMLAACSTDDEQGTNTAANEVKITANVGGNSIFTRSNPLGTEAEQQSFNENDAISRASGKHCYNCKCSHISCNLHILSILNVKQFFNQSLFR